METQRSRKSAHTLSEVDPEKRTGVCATCGQVPISKSVDVRNGKQYWRCAVRNRKYAIASIRRRKKHLDYRGDTCERCGFIPEHEVQLDVHHKDGDRNNNNPSNLATLCANCHRLDIVGLLNL
jgi:predicted RNA-binding Zn-ribbon protein involved in translation (DUF1610 family)